MDPKNNANLSDGIDQEKLEKALKITGGNLEKAKNLITGKENDTYALKINFACSDVNKYGLVVIFLNYQTFAMKKIFCVSSKNNQICNEKAHSSWEHFLSTVLEATYSDINDITSTSQVASNLEREMTPAIMNVICEKISSKDDHSLHIQFEKIISFVFKSLQTDIQINYEKTSSIMVDDVVSASKSQIENKSKENITTTKKSSADFIKGDTTAIKMDQELVAQGNSLIGCKLVLSPIKGKYMSQLIPGDIVKVKIIDKSPRAMAVAEKLGLTLGGKMTSTDAKIISITKLETGWLIYTIISKNLVGKVVEEEEVKVYTLDEDDLQKKGKSKNYIVWVLVIILILAIVGFFFIQPHL